MLALALAALHGRYKGMTPAIPVDDTFPCKFCEQRFSKEPILEQHVLTKHPGAEEYLKVLSSSTTTYWQWY